MVAHAPKSSQGRRRIAPAILLLSLALTGAVACEPVPSPTPSTQPVTKPVATPTATPKPSVTPTTTPTTTPKPSVTPTTTPTATPKPSVTPTTTPTPMVTPAPIVTPKPTVTPTPTPTPTATPTPTPAPTLGVPAKQADSVVDAFGVNVHMNYPGRYQDVPKVTQNLQNLGARHVRDEIYNFASKEWPALRSLGAAGIKANLIMGRPDHSSGTPEQLAMRVKTELLASGVVESLEGANEWDHSGRASWASEVKAHQTHLYKVIKGDPALAKLPVLMPSLAKRTGWDLIGSLDAVSDYGNIHLYPGGKVPSIYVDQVLSASRVSAGPQKIMTTEAGFTDAMNNTTTHLPTPQNVSAIYGPRLLLEHYNRGVARMYSYELIDQREDPGLTDREANFGLLNYDWTPKPEYVALKNLIGLLNDKGAAFAPGKLDYKVANAPADLRQTLVQKRDGRFYLMLWRDCSIWDPTTKTAVTCAASNVSVTLGQAADVNRYRPSKQAAAVATTAATKSLTIPVGSDVQVLEVKLK